MLIRDRAELQAAGGILRLRIGKELLYWWSAVNTVESYSVNKRLRTSNTGVKDVVPRPASVFLAKCHRSDSNTGTWQAWPTNKIGS